MPSRYYTDLAELARRMQAETGHGTTALLESVTVQVVSLIPGAWASGVTLCLNSKKRSVQTIGATNSAAAEFDVLQREVGIGPCLEAAWEGHVVRVDDFATDTRWPPLSDLVVSRTPIRSSVSYQLFVGVAELGALNVYSPDTNAFDAVAVELGYAFATHAALVLDAERKHEQFTSALATRDIIGQAKGMIMERFDVNATSAFGLLTRLSQDQNIPVAELARRLVTADHPDGPPVNP